MATSAGTLYAQYTISGCLVKKFRCTGGTTAGSITHGESRSPDFVIVTMTDAEGGAPTQTGVICDYETSATVLTIDTVVDAAQTFDVVCFWATSASGGLNPPA